MPRRRPAARATYAEVAERADRLASGAAVARRRSAGDRVATFSWNTQEHLEAYLAVPCMGAVLHTLNIRLFPEQLEYIVNHAEDRVVFVDASLVAGARASCAARLRRRAALRGRRRRRRGRAAGRARATRSCWRAQEPGFDWPELDDRMAAGLCYTSGTTGNPKGVLYSHRSNVLHALGHVPGRRARRLARATACCRSSRCSTPTPGACPTRPCMAGADLVMPGPYLQAEPLARLIEAERATIAGAVPTIWIDLLRYADEHSPTCRACACVVCGGSRRAAVADARPSRSATACGSSRPGA